MQFSNTFFFQQKNPPRKSKLTACEASRKMEEGNGHYFLFLPYLGLKMDLK